MYFIGTEWHRVAKKAIVSKFEKHAVYEPQNLSPYLAVTGIYVLKLRNTMLTIGHLVVVLGHI